MEFTIRNKDGMGMFYTEYECCVPVEYVDSMASAGLTFYLDGKKISASKVKELFKNAKPVKVPKYADPPEFVDPKETLTESVTKSKESKTNLEESKTKEPKKTISLVPKKSSEPDLSNLDFPITSRTIICNNNGKVYRNQTEAGKDLGIDPSYISECITKNKEYKGYSFKKVLSA